MTATLNLGDQRFADPGYKYGTQPNVFYANRPHDCRPPAACWCPVTAVDIRKWACDRGLAHVMRWVGQRLRMNMTYSA